LIVDASALFDHLALPEVPENASATYTWSGHAEALGYGGSTGGWKI
jgi:hypothetical protein